MRSDKGSLFPSEETTRVLGANYYFSEKRAKKTLIALNLRDSSLRIKTAIHVSKSCRTYLVIPM